MIFITHEYTPDPYRRKSGIPLFFTARGSMIPALMVCVRSVTRTAETRVGKRAADEGLDSLARVTRGAADNLDAVRAEHADGAPAHVPGDHVGNPRGREIGEPKSPV